MIDSQDNCACRKPKPGMILRAIKEYALEPESCWIIGDSQTDIQAGIAAGITKTILINNCDGESFKKILKTILC